MAAIKDLGVNFFLTEEDVNNRKTRASAVAPRLQELNTMCAISVEDKLTFDVVRKHNALIITEPWGLSKVTEYNEFCRSNKISFFYAFTCGISTTIFVDHGENHVVNDANGEQPVEKLITDISLASATELLIRYDHPAGQLPEAVSSGHFEITDVNGPSAINHQSYEVRRDPSDPVKTVRIVQQDAQALLANHPYVSGGMLHEKKVPKPHPMLSFAHKVKSPGNTFAEPPTLVLTDLLNFGSELQQHVMFVALLQFIDERNAATGNGGAAYSVIPTIGDTSGVDAVVATARKVLANGAVVIEDFELDATFATR